MTVEEPDLLGCCAVFLGNFVRRIEETCRLHLQCQGSTLNLEDEGDTVRRRGGNKLRNHTDQHVRRSDSSIRKQRSN